jgi:hypothetical protein
MMSRDWNEHKYNSSENLWCWIDEEAEKIERSIEDGFRFKSDHYRMLAIGRKEMLEKLGDWLKDNETTLGEIAERWGLGVRDDQ